MFGSTSDLELQVALAIGTSAFALGAAIVLQVLAMRVRSQQRTQLQSDVHALWRPLLARAALGEQPQLPRLADTEVDDLLLLWTQMQDGIRGSGHDGLNKVASDLGLRDKALAWLDRGSLAQRVLGLATLGHLGRAEDRARLAAALHDEQALVSLAAARALLQANASASAPLVLDEYLRRADWPAARVGTLLRDAGAEAVAEAFMQRLREAEDETQLRLLRLLRFVESPRVGSVLRDLIEHSENPQVLSIALRQVHAPDVLPRVRRLAQHGDALVRSAAAVVLGRVGTLDDRPLLVAMMSDKDWWVRYRAAQAVVALPGMDAVALAALHAGLRDRYARDMLDQVRAETPRAKMEEAF